MQLAVAPGRILLGQTENERCEVSSDGWTTSDTRASKGPFPTDKLAVPLQHRLRFEQEDNLAQPRARLAVDGREPRGQDC